MSLEFFVPTCTEPSESFQQGLDQGHSGLTSALSSVLQSFPPHNLKALSRELDFCAETNRTSPLAEKIYQRAICVYQAEQLLKPNAGDRVLSTKIESRLPHIPASGSVSRLAS